MHYMTVVSLEKSDEPKNCQAILGNDNKHYHFFNPIEFAVQSL